MQPANAVPGLSKDARLFWTGSRQRSGTDDGQPPNVETEEFEGKEEGAVREARKTAQYDSQNADQSIAAATLFEIAATPSVPVEEQVSSVAGQRPSDAANDSSAAGAKGLEEELQGLPVIGLQCATGGPTDEGGSSERVCTF